jgi:hypothetical protein
MVTIAMLLEGGQARKSFLAMFPARRRKLSLQGHEDEKSRIASAIKSHSETKKILNLLENIFGVIMYLSHI